MSEKNQLVLIWWAIVFAVIYGLSYYFLTGFFPPPPANLNNMDVLELYAASNMALRIGVVICLLVGAFQLPWVVVVAVQMARLEKGRPVWAITQLMAGAIGALLFILPPLFWGVAAFSVERSPEITVLMHELAFLTLITPVSLFLFQSLPVAFVAFQQGEVNHSAFPRWLGYFSVWLTISAECGALAQLFKSGPFAWNGLFTFWLPLTIFSVWFAVLSYTMIKAIKAQAGEVPHPSSVASTSNL